MKRNAAEIRHAHGYARPRRKRPVPAACAAI